MGQKAYASVGSAGQPIFVGYALIEHWDGKAWQEVPAAGLPGTGEDGVLRAIAALSGADDGAWAAGSYYEPALSVQAQRTLIQRYLE